MNKPVAYIDHISGKPKLIDAYVVQTDYDIPLYTNPVKDKPHPKCDEACMYLCQMRELTDEEIYRLLADSIWAVGLNTDCLDEQNWADGITVAKAILRKAQENGNV